MAKMKKIIEAGNLRQETIYPVLNPTDSNGVRAGKKTMSSEAQRRMNLKYAYQKLEFLMAANFGVRDLFVTFTYDDCNLPYSRKEAKANMSYFWKKVRAVRHALKKELFYIYVTEHKHGDARWHHHALINATGADYGLIKSLWPYGIVEFRKIRVDKEKNYETLARYFCKEERDKLGQRLWSGSRNLRKPETECFKVSDDTPLIPPPNSAILVDSGDVRTAYGHYRYIKFISGGWPETSEVHAKRRRTKKEPFIKFSAL